MNSSAAFRTGRCFLSTNRQQLDAETCLKPDPARPNYLLVGDSHAAHLWFGLSLGDAGSQHHAGDRQSLPPGRQPGVALRHAGMPQP